eukprot:TRINITY_DN43362_c0_g1_i2.p1 TRINITY_DN43362_c0_g1~~TRINITY_DN43362_c0_g1_i2.p1  ORF type:complete len:531 (+),score=150.19 TRINITY_DN43362_c0_g1_i2:174-1766(+)
MCIRDRMMSDSDEDNAHGPLRDADGTDWTHKVFEWRELHGDGRRQNVDEFAQTLRKQKFVRILLPEEVVGSYDRVSQLSGAFFDMEEEQQDESIEFSEMRTVQGKLTGFTHQRLRQQYECRMTGEDKPIPCPYAPEGLEAAIKTHFDLMEGCGRFVLGVLSEGMGVNPKWFYDLLDQVEGETSEEPTSPCERRRKLPDPESTTANILRMMQYHSETDPDVETDGAQVLCTDHLDVGFVTISLISDNPCVQGYRADRQWHDIEYTATGKRNEAIIWVGEQMEKVTNGYYKPLRHRVLRPSANPPWMRVQNTFFLRGRPQAVVNATLATRVPCKRPGLLRKFQTTTVRQLMAVDAAKAILHDYLEDKRAQIKAFKAEQAAQEQRAQRVPMSTHVRESAIVSASIDSVWNAVRVMDFGFDPMVAGGELVDGEAATQVGAVHTLHFKDGTEWTLQTSGLSDQKRVLSFELLARTDGVECSSCQHSIRLTPVTLSNSTFVEWTVDFSNDAEAQVLMDCQYKRQDALRGLQAYFAE